MVEDYMTYGCTIGKIDSKVSDIARIMKEKDIGFLPITEEKKIIGIITDRDLVIGPIANADDKIEPYLQRNVKWVEKGDSLEKALKIMEENKIKRLLVKEQEKIIGMISLSDLFRSDHPNLLKTIESIFTPIKEMREQTAEVDSFYL